MKLLINIILMWLIVYSVDCILPKPHISAIRSFDTGFEVTWDPVTDSDPKHPIGYKLSVWEPEYRTVFKNMEVNGTQTLVETKEVVEPGIFDLNQVPKRPPTIVITSKETSATVNDIKKGVFYDIRVQAYTDEEIGPLSSSTGLKIH